VSILPVDQGIEHSAGASFAPNPQYFDPENIVKLAHRGRLQRGGVDARRARHVRAQVRAPDSFILKLNHNEFISYPNSYDQIRFASVKQASTWARPASARRSISDRRIEAADPGSGRDVPARARARHVHRAVVLPAQLRPSRPRTVDYHLAADLTARRITSA
jgi:class I fructose-bisphosphate aldolase